MTLFQQLAQAIKTALEREPDSDLAPNWRELLEKVQVLDYVMYLPHKCHLAGCKDGIHVCGQDSAVKEIVHVAVDAIVGPAGVPGIYQVLTREAVDGIVTQAINQALGNIDISDERMVIMTRIDELARDCRRGCIRMPDSFDDIFWLANVAKKTVQLYAREAYNSWCKTHRQQHTFCGQCLSTYVSRSLVNISMAIKEYCQPDQIEQIVSRSADKDFTELVMGQTTNAKPKDGGF